MNKNIDAIVWSMLSGIDCIDEQHQMLASMINTAQSQLTTHSGREEIEALIHDLMAYALFHFDTEEELMLTHNYEPTEREKHCQEHRSFSAAIAQFQHNIHLGNLISRDELLKFITEWFIHHTMNTDKKLGAFLCKQQVTDL